LAIGKILPSSRLILEIRHVYFRFRINRQSDPKRQFSIDQTGSLRVAQSLDREDIPKYNLIVEAFDQAGNVGQQRIEIYLQDVNDNAPVPYTVPDPCVFMENTDPAMQPRCEIRAYDLDTMENGPPFYMEVAPDFKYSSYLNLQFNKYGDNGNGSMTVIAKQRFDREAEFPGKQLEIPLILQDRGGLRVERSVYIIIGDENDNPMKDGEMTIFVNSYRGQLAKTMIGRVYVEDKDDWDLPDKLFTWVTGRSLPGFSLAPNGEITMDSNMPPRTYKMVANVTDKRRGETALGAVTVIVKLVPEAAFENQGVVRILLGIGGLPSPDKFITTDSTGSSPMSRFVDKMNEYLNGNAVIDVFSIKVSGYQAILQTSTPKVLDVRFSAHSSPYRSPVFLNGLVAQYRADLEKAIGATIVSAGIDMCKFTICDKGCRTVNYANNMGVVVAANQTVIVGVNAWSNDTCTCPIFMPPPSCRANLCLNSGVCHNTYPGFFCECRNNAFQGFRCQGTTRSFDGQGYAWFKPMPACTSLNISLHFMTKQPNSLLLYNGPMGSDNSQSQVDYRDYLIIRLVSGRIEAELMFNGVASNIVQLAGSDMLNDGKWHAVTLMQIGKIIELVIDGLDDSSCRRTVLSMDDDERLNVIAPLQVGGLAPLSGGDRYPSAVTSRSQSFSGCLRNLIINGEMYDLGVPDFADEAHSQPGCIMTEEICGANEIGGGYCVHGECIADSITNIPKCLCAPGFGGDRCDHEMKWIEFGPGSFVEYDVKVGLEDKTTNVDVLFLPGRGNGGSGELGFGSSGDKVSSINYVPTAKFDLNANSLNISLSNVRLESNASYWMQFSRNPVRTELSIDGMYHESMPLDPSKMPFEISISQLLLGAQSIGGARGFQGCVGSFRWQHINLPLSEAKDTETTSLTNDESIISIKRSKGVSLGCSQRTTCATVGFAYCAGSLICVNFWKGAFCTCPDGAQVLLGPDGQLVGCGETLAVSSLGISSPAFSSLIFLLLAYNLRKPVIPIENNGIGGYAPPIYPRPAIDDKLNNRIKNLESDPDATAPYDELRIYDDEGDNISRVTLESLESVDDGQTAGNLDQEVRFYNA
uniref:Neural-cadherin n=1 Tax=Dracunculus medinensis TaxID=318479 RepID=A0A158Q3C5_DRAME